jgi:antitoxin MazE
MRQLVSPDRYSCSDGFAVTGPAMMKIQFAKWGNSVALRVPSKVAEALAIAPGSVADLDLRRDKLIITPHPHAYQLEDLLASITTKNLHHEVSTGVAVGAEVID